MHKKPDDHGFGTGLTNEALKKSHEKLLDCLSANTRVLASVSHYLKWLAEQQTGQIPSPPMRDDLRED